MPSPRYRGPRSKRSTPDAKARELLDRYGKVYAHVAAARNAATAKSELRAQWWGTVLRWIEVLSSAGGAA